MQIRRTGSATAPRVAAVLIILSMMAAAAAAAGARNNDDPPSSPSISGGEHEYRFQLLWRDVADAVRDGWRSYVEVVEAAADRRRASGGAGDGRPQNSAAASVVAGGAPAARALHVDEDDDGAAGVANDGNRDDDNDDDDAEARYYLNFGIRPALQLTGLPGKAAVVNFTSSPVNTLVRGTLYLFQATVYSELVVRGTLTGLNPGETVNVHVRQRGDVSLQCANQGFLYNPNNIPTGGFLVKSVTADATGKAAVSTTAFGIDANLWGPGLLSIIRRSARIATGASNSAGTLLGCGKIVAAAVGPNTVNS